MSLYAQAAQQGMSTLQLLGTGSNAATKAAYNESYQKTAQKFNLAQAKHTSQLNISATKQDKILTDTTIQMQQDQAQALAKVSAAASGVEGGSVDDIIYDTEKNEALALASNAKQSEANIEQHLASIYSNQSSLLAVQDDEISMMGNLVESFGSFEMGDLEIMEAFWNEPEEDK